jgi:hypothetical protein
MLGLLFPLCRGVLSVACTCSSVRFSVRVSHPCGGACGGSDASGNSGGDMAMAS